MGDNSIPARTPGIALDRLSMDFAAQTISSGRLKATDLVTAKQAARLVILDMADVAVSTRAELCRRGGIVSATRSNTRHGAGVISQTSCVRSWLR